MIVPMRKVYIVCRRHERHRLLDALGELGVVHIAPVDPAKAVVDEPLAARIASSAVRRNGITNLRRYTVSSNASCRHGASFA